MREETRDHWLINAHMTRTFCTAAPRAPKQTSQSRSRQ